MTARWLGEENASLPAVAGLARGLAARDIALGLAALATLGDADADGGAGAARLQAGCALADAGDVLGTLLARRRLPRAGVLGTVALAGASAAAELALARALRRA